MLNPMSPVPLYHQLADILTERIRSGQYAEGAVIPSETGMAKHYGIGRPTVRQAMEVLVRKGMVERKRGSGTFVTYKDRQVDLFAMAGTSRAFLAKGIKTNIRIITPLALGRIDNEPDNPFNEGKAFFVSRLTLVAGEPVLLEDIYLHPGLFPGLDKVDFESKSLSRVVSDQYYLAPVTGHQTFKISFLTADRSRLLGLELTDPILEVERKLDFPGVDEAVYSRLYCRTDQFAFSQTIHLAGV